ncbi:MAG: hypothetical protein ACXW3Z_09340 [Limisphaerales bacterium]
MTTALLVFLGLSSCVTLFIVAAFALNARVSLAYGEADASETMEGAGTSQSPTMVPSFSH